MIYVFILAFIIWALLIPLRPKNWSYKNVLLFITLTSPPAVLYAIPVEQFMSLELAQKTNVWFFAIVATWRDAHLVIFLKRAANLSGFTILVASLLPLVLIVTLLSILNLEHVVFKIMAGLKEHERSVNDTAYLILVLITYTSLMLSPILLASYAWLVHKVRRENALNK